MSSTAKALQSAQEAVAKCKTYVATREDFISAIEAQDRFTNIESLEAQQGVRIDGGHSLV